ncbi:MAG: hypothetical protein JJ863_11910 [Deltaproteobacteria bacterium]|nr:hypothetical protein [Deltaproteobacteria bacterium]
MALRGLRWLLLGVLLASCGTDDLTQLMVVVDTDFQVPGEMDEIRIEVVGPTGDAKTAESPISTADLPMRLAVVHRGGPLGPVTVKVEGNGPLPDGRRGVVIQRRAVVEFVEGEVRVLQMDLLRVCQGVVCDSGSTCADGDCRTREVSEDELPPWDGPMRTDFGVPDVGPEDMGADACLAEELCNDVDDDCDGAVDEDFDFDVDMLHCGGCNQPCNPDPARGSTTCEAGECVLACDDGFADCDMSGGDEDSNGCEVSLVTAENCGSCGNDCPAGAPICDIDKCVADCPEGTSLCAGGTCADLTSSVNNCGACGTACEDADNASPFCTESACALRCDTGFFNCDMMTGNGCESRQRDVANCGACGAVCSTPNGVPSCVTGTCEVVGCNVGFDDCDSDAMNGCEADVAGDPATCGGCGITCPADPPNASPICTMGTCGVACIPGYANCNMDSSDGCETFLGSATSCGACGVSCDGATPLCSGSTSTGFSCTGGCGAGETLCDGSCVNIASDVANCNGCEMPCTDPPRASPTCSAGVCGFTCDMGFADCDMSAGNGCETATTTTMNCNTCGNSCAPAPSATISCTTSGCIISGCTGDMRNCDGMYANGCETNITSSASHCGGCGVTCVPGMRVQNVGCTAGACEITQCEPGYADCDGDFATGCEQALGTRFHCSACGDRCMGGGMNRCCDGVCGSC